MHVFKRPLWAFGHPSGVTAFRAEMGHLPKFLGVRKLAKEGPYDGVGRRRDFLAVKILAHPKLFPPPSRP